MTSVNCRVGDRLLLTKPLGCGILATALKGESLFQSEELLPQLRRQLAGQDVLACEIGRVIAGEAGVVLR